MRWHYPERENGGSEKEVGTKERLKERDQLTQVSEGAKESDEHQDFVKTAA